MQGRRREQGVVMFLTVLLLALMGGLGLAALDSASRDRDSAGYYNRERPSTRRRGRAARRGEGSQQPFDPGLRGQGSRGLGDTRSTRPRRRLALPNYGDGLQASAGRHRPGLCDGRTPASALDLWRINVEGAGPDGSTARIEAKEAKCFFGVGGSRY
jgi:hypothetical protein